jgi:hypothetical protein
MPIPSFLRRGQGGSLENALIKSLTAILPVWAFKRLPTLYYRLNRYRFRFMSRPVMLKETSKAKLRRQKEGFFDRFFVGKGLDVGYGGDLVVPNCRGWDVEDGDAHDLRGVADESFDFV